MSDIISETQQRLAAEKAQVQKWAMGQQILLAFYRNHPEFTVCEANDRAIENFLRGQGKTEFSLQTLEDGVATFGPAMARDAPKIPLPHVPVTMEPEVLPLVPYTRS